MTTYTQSFLVLREQIHYTKKTANQPNREEQHLCLTRLAGQCLHSDLGMQVKWFLTALTRWGIISEGRRWMLSCHIKGSIILRASILV